MKRITGEFSGEPASLHRHGGEIIGCEAEIELSRPEGVGKEIVIEF